jgi:hypothetical protein
MSEWKNISLKEIFDEKELEDVELILRERDWKYLRKYLNDRKEKLEKKGLVADYLYYVLLNQFGG